MKKSVLMFLQVIFLIFGFNGEYYAQTKVTVSKRILNSLQNTAQLVKEGWHFDFVDNHCSFVKSKRYHERDGTLTSTYSTLIPLEKVKIESEMKSYDSFFQCIDEKQCVSRLWEKANGEIIEQSTSDSASLYIKNGKISKQVFDQFTYLRTLCDRSQYAGPSGINWGDSIEEVTPVLSARFKFVNQDTAQNGALFHQEYHDTFAGYQTESIRVGFVDNKFFEMLVIPKQSSTGSIAKKWYDIVQTIKDKYGKPNILVLPSSIRSLQEITNEKYFKDFSVFDSEIRERNWYPLAVWKYQNHASIKVEIVQTALDWQVHWQFLHDELQKLAEVRISENPVDDF